LAAGVTLHIAAQPSWLCCVLQMMHRPLFDAIRPVAVQVAWMAHWSCCLLGSIAMWDSSARQTLRTADSWQQSVAAALGCQFSMLCSQWRQQGMPHVP
jgi:hypothetical protein